MAKLIDEQSYTELLRVPAQQRLFVYGTLMSSAGNGYGQHARTRLLQEVPQRFAAQTQGQLYELGQYPGLVVSPDADDDADDTVHGQLLVLPNPLATLAWLDEYEAISPAPDADNEYVRQLREVHVAGRVSMSAWTYVYVKSVVGLARVKGGRWLAHARQQRVG